MEPNWHFTSVVYLQSGLKSIRVTQKSFIFLDFSLWIAKFLHNLPSVFSLFWKSTTLSKMGK